MHCRYSASCWPITCHFDDEPLKLTNHSARMCHTFSDCLMFTNLLTFKAEIYDGCFVSPSIDLYSAFTNVYVFTLLCNSTASEK